MEEKYKIGEEVRASEDATFKTIGGRDVDIKEGDIGYLDSKGFVHYTTGNAKGLMHQTDVELNGYDLENIAMIIYRNLDKEYDLGSFIQQEEIDISYFVSCIEETLEEVLDGL